MLKTGVHLRTTDNWEDLGAAAKTWDTWKTAYKTTDMKERVRRLAMSENAAHGALHQTVAPQGTAIDDLLNKDDLKDDFDNLAASATTKKVVLAQLKAAIVAMTINNEALVATNSKLVAEVATLTIRLGQNSDGATSGNTPDKRSPKTCPHCKKEGFHKPDTCLELVKNTRRRPPDWKSSL